MRLPRGPLHALFLPPGRPPAFARGRHALSPGLAAREPRVSLGASFTIKFLQSLGGSSRPADVPFAAPHTREVWSLGHARSTLDGTLVPLRCSQTSSSTLIHSLIWHVCTKAAGFRFFAPAGVTSPMPV